MSAPTTYQYRRPPSCNHRVLTIKVYEAFNLRPTSVDWFQGFSGDDETIYVHTARELTREEKAKLDGLMARPDAGFYPERRDETVFLVDDLFDAWARIEEAVGARIRWIFPNVPDHTKLEIWFDRRLSPEEKGKVLSEYTKLITEKA